MEENNKTHQLKIIATIFLIIVSFIFLYIYPPLFIFSAIYLYVETLSDSIKNNLPNELGKFIGFLLILSLVVFTFTNFFGNEDINSIFCKNELKFKGYVYAFPDDTKDKNYRLKADMYKDGNDYGVDRIYFYNGGYIDFESCEEGNKDGYGFYCTPLKDERNWTFMFYGEQIKNKK